jgi:hypothetical protein
MILPPPPPTHTHTHTHTCPHIHITQALNWGLVVRALLAKLPPEEESAAPAEPFPPSTTPDAPTAGAAVPVPPAAARSGMGDGDGGPASAPAAAGVGEGVDGDRITPPSHQRPAPQQQVLQGAADAAAGAAKVGAPPRPAMTTPYAER